MKARTAGFGIMPAALALTIALSAGLAPSRAVAQQQSISSWPAGNDQGAVPDATKSPKTADPGNTTVLTRTPVEGKAILGAQANATQLTLVALLTQDGQRIDQGLVWRIFSDNKEPSGKRRVLVTSRDASPVFRLPPGDYMINAAFGRANLTRRISVKPGTPSMSEPFVLNAGGLRITVVSGNGETVPANMVAYDILADERDQSGDRNAVLAGAKPGIIVRLNSGIYHIVSTYGDANAVVNGDVSVEAGKLTDARITHAAAKVTLKLVMRAGGEALADTLWTIFDADGEVVKESAGALPTHTLAPGKYTVVAKSGGRSFRRDFAVQNGENTHVEVVMQ